MHCEFVQAGAPQLTRAIFISFLKEDFSPLMLIKPQTCRYRKEKALKLKPTSRDRLD